MICNHSILRGVARTWAILGARSGILRGWCGDGGRASLRHCERGVSSIEFGVLAGALAMMTLGLLDFGIGLWEKLEVSDAVRAGAQYAAKSGYDSTNIQAAEAHATNLSGLSTSAPVQFSGCPDATNGITTPPCADGSAPGSYITIRASVSYSTIFSWPGLSNPMTLASNVTIRVD
ncbi:MAG: TadE/TadG family type IV pilus assembly protein [Thiohalocapsa sp.]